VRGAYARGAYAVGFEAGATHRESQELAAGVLAVRKDRSPLEGASSGACYGKSRQRRLEEGLCS
jgi:hypothetical protein